MQEQDKCLSRMNEILLESGRAPLINLAQGARDYGGLSNAARIILAESVHHELPVFHIEYMGISFVQDLDKRIGFLIRPLVKRDVIVAGHGLACSLDSSGDECVLAYFDSSAEMSSVKRGLGFCYTRGVQLPSLKFLGSFPSPRLVLAEKK